MEQQENVLPIGFDGVFRFTNPTEDDFEDKWNSVVYHFPAMKTVPLIIPNETQEGIQSIRKKFAKTLAEREFYKSDKGQRMQNREAGPRPALYTETDLEPYIQKCLEPLPMAYATATTEKREPEKAFKRDNKGNPRTRVLEPEDSLVGDGQVVA